MQSAKSTGVQRFLRNQDSLRLVIIPVVTMMYRKKMLDHQQLPSNFLIQGLLFRDLLRKQTTPTPEATVTELL